MQIYTVWTVMDSRLIPVCPYSQLFWPTFSPHFPAFGLNTERYTVSLRIQYNRENAGKMQATITPNTDTFYVVWGEKVLESAKSTDTTTLSLMQWLRQNHSKINPKLQLFTNKTIYLVSCNVLHTKTSIWDRIML